MDAQKGKERQDWALLFNALLHSLETGDVGWEKKNQREKDFCWDRKVHSTTSQFSGRFCEKLSEAKPRPKFVNKPLSNFDLLQWVDFLKIPNFKGIFARDEVMPRKHSPCIINLDSLENAGTHWVCCVPGGRALWYFDSFGMGFPQEFKSSKPVIWNSSQLQNINSVLCGYYCLYFLHQWAQGKDFYDILKPFSCLIRSKMKNS